MVSKLCVHRGKDLSLQSLLGSYLDNGNDFKDADPVSISGETTLNTSDEGVSTNGQTRAQSPVDSGVDVKGASGTVSSGVDDVIELE
jgi:hypothetical protein